MTLCFECGYPDAALGVQCPVCASIVGNSLSPTIPKALPPGTMLGQRQFRVGRCLGAGSSLTYRGCALQLLRPVIIKEAFAPGCGRCDLRVQSDALGELKEARLSLVEEARLQERVRHSAVAPVRAVFEEHGTTYLVLSHRDGKTLRQISEAKGPWGQESALTVAQTIADALRAVHEAEIVHGDIGPNNLLLDEAENLTLLDFGAATEDLKRSPRTRRLPANLLGPTAMRGTPGYAPPEGYGNRGALSRSSDVYALGATLFFLLTGQDPPPAPERLHLDTLKRDLQSVIPPPSSALLNLVEVCMNLEVLQRPQTVDEVLKRFDSIRSGWTNSTSVSAPGVPISTPAAPAFVTPAPPPTIPLSVPPFSQTGAPNTRSKAGRPASVFCNMGDLIADASVGCAIGIMWITSSKPLGAEAIFCLFLLGPLSAVGAVRLWEPSWAPTQTAQKRNFTNHLLAGALAGAGAMLGVGYTAMVWAAWMTNACEGIAAMIMCALFFWLFLLYGALVGLVLGLLIGTLRIVAER